MTPRLTIDLSDEQTPEGLRAEMEDRFAQVQHQIDRLTAMVAHPAWCVPLTEDEEGEDAAGSGPVLPCDAPSPSTGECSPPDLQGPEKGDERFRLFSWEPLRVKPNTDELLGCLPPRNPNECARCGDRTLGPDEIAVTLPRRLLDRTWVSSEIRSLARWANDTGSGEASDLLNAIADGLDDEGSSDDEITTEDVIGIPKGGHLPRSVVPANHPGTANGGRAMSDNLQAALREYVGPLDYATGPDHSLLAEDEDGDLCGPASHGDNWWVAYDPNNPEHVAARDKTKETGLIVMVHSGGTDE